MRTEQYVCDRCEAPIISAGVRGMYLTVEGNGWAKSTVIGGKDFCEDCRTIIAKAIHDVVRRISKVSK